LPIATVHRHRHRRYRKGNVN